MVEPLTYPEAAKRLLLNEPIEKQDATLWTARSDEAGRRYYSLQYAVSRGTMLAEVPRLFAVVVKSHQWKQWTWSGRPYEAPTLAEYVTRNPPNGLGATLEMAKMWVRDDPEALAIFTMETTGVPGAHLPNDNIIRRTEQGTSRAYTVGRLKRERDDLYQQVLAGKLSVNAAAAKAGWRKNQEPFAIMKRHIHKLTNDEWTALIELRTKGP
jgi:hypothetical protein